MEDTRKVGILIAETARIVGIGGSRSVLPGLLTTWAELWQKTVYGRFKKRARNREDEHHTAPRYPLSQPVTVRFASSGHYEFSGLSKNMSTSGIYLHANSVIAEGAHVEVILTLPSDTERPVSLRVSGKVVRIDDGSTSGIAIAFGKLVIEPDALRFEAQQSRQVQCAKRSF